MRKIVKVLVINILLISFIFVSVIFLDIKIGEKMNFKYAGYNYKGYRGEIKGPKKKEFQRIITLGGSTTFGYGTTFKESWPYLLEQLLQKKEYKIDIVNLGLQSNTIRGILLDLNHYDYFDFDIAIIYSGYNDCFYRGLTEVLARHQNFFFKNFGYLPIIQTYLVEKTVITIGKDINEFYASKKKSYIMCDDKSVEDISSEDISVFINKINDNYIKNFRKVIENLISQNKTIVVMHQPIMYTNGGKLQKIQKDLLKKMLRDYETVKQVDTINSLDVSNKNLFFDNQHLKYEGNLIISKLLYNFLSKEKLIN